MNLRIVERDIKRFLNKELGLDFEFERKDDRLRATNELTLRGHDDNIYVAIDMYESGSFGVDFVFDKLEENPQTLALINEFNRNSVWLTAMIRDDGYLVLRYNVMAGTVDDLAGNIRGIMNQLTTDKIGAVLKPLTQLTQSD
ncbi:MAG TPA: YbjN domain-containing protein [Firmicutes bacterium]|nr:YbjN domain-containing protein [Bacillota bacterium]